MIWLILGVLLFTGIHMLPTAPTARGRVVERLGEQPYKGLFSLVALGGIVLTNQIAALTALAVGWAIMMPLLMWLSENLDGMPGRRRNWIAERSQ